jgi:hypothetical protein
VFSSICRQAMGVSLDASVFTEGRLLTALA